MPNESILNDLLLSPLHQETFLDYTFDKSIDTNMTIINSTDYSSVYRLVIRCLSIYALLLVIIGTLGNTLTIIVLCRPKLRRFVTMRYLIAVSVFDIVSLYGWNLNNFYKFTISNNDSNIEQLSLMHCRIVSFVTFVGLQLSSWCLTVVSIDRCLSLYFLNWRQNFGKLSRTKYHIAIVTVTCLLLNCHILIYNGYRANPPDNTVKCYATRTNSYYIFPQWERVHLVVYNLCPFIIMLLCNIYIISITIRSARVRTVKSLNSPGSTTRPQSPRHRQLSLMLMLVTFAFVLLTLPSCLYFVFFRHQMSPAKYSRSYRHMVQICLSSVQFTSHAINFFLYCFSATNFRNELRDLITNLFANRSSSKLNRKATTDPATMKLTTATGLKDTRSVALHLSHPLNKRPVTDQKASKHLPTTMVHQETKIGGNFDSDSSGSSE